MGREKVVRVYWFYIGCRFWKYGWCDREIECVYWFGLNFIGYGFGWGGVVSRGRGRLNIFRIE